VSHESSHHHVTISKGRFEAFSDGVFAIAITLLVLELRPPDIPPGHDELLVPALLSMWPEFLVYGASFATIGIMWFNHYALFHNARTISYTALIANLALLSLVCFVPFTTLLMARVGLTPIAAAFYNGVFFVLSVCFNVLFYAVLLRKDEHGSVIDFLRRRTLWNSLGLIAYAAAALAAFWSPLASVLLSAAIALFYMLPSTVRSTLVSTEELEGAERSCIASGPRCDAPVARPKA